MLVQLSRHELALRRHGEITLDDGRVVLRKGREIERIAVTLTDHGSLQDRIFLGSLVRSLFGSRFTTTDSAFQAVLDKTTNEAAKALTENIIKLADSAGEGVEWFLQAYTIGTWWLSVDQLWFICEEAGDLWRGLRPLRHITYRSGDLMTELAHLDKAAILKWNTGGATKE